MCAPDVAANEVAKVATTVPGIGDGRMMGQHNLSITIDRQAIARYSLSAADVNDVIETPIGDRTATEIHEGERRFQAVVRLPNEFRDSVSDIRGILLRTPDGGQVPLSSVAQIERREGTSQIKRDMARRGWWLA